MNRFDAVSNRKKEDRIDEYAEKLLELVLSRGNRLPRTYGFEYEFLPHRILQHEDMDRLKLFLEDRGYALSDGMYVRDNRRIVFEPGGQIEYLSPPMKAAEREEFRAILDWIRSTNSQIDSETGIRYVGTDYIHGRYDAPLLLTSKRYWNMHERFRRVDERGPDMMKGTAAIHLHAAVTSREDFLGLHRLFTELSDSEEFGMSNERRQIWNKTDSCRCGLPKPGRRLTASSITRCIVECAMKAEELNTEKPFRDIPDTDFQDFLDHLTTMFTDVRVNVKGGTLELRTLDSRPLEEFESTWSEFLNECEKVV